MKIIQAYPHFEPYQSIEGIYLNEIPLDSANPIIYGNFLGSLDGRIAIQKDKQMILPDSLSSLNDTHLFMQLRSQADCLITHGGYMRSLEAGILGNILNAPTGKEYRYLSNNQIEPQIVICSNSLNFTIPPDINSDRIIIATSQQGNTARKAEWQQHGYQVIEAGEKLVTANTLMPYLFNQGMKRFYLCAGPDLFESCCADGYLNRLYFTLSFQMLGEENFLTMIKGSSELQGLNLTIKRLIVDKTQKRECIFVALECHHHY